MAYQQIPGQGMLYPDWNITGGTASTVNSTTAITATTHKIAFIGRVFNKDRSSKSITKIGVRTGTVVKAGGADLKLSIQGVSTSGGPPYQPDGTIKGAGNAGHVTIATGSLASAGWNHSGALGANISVTFGELIAVVAESPSWAGSDSVPLAGITAATSGPWQASGTSYYNAATWAQLSVIPNVILEFTDGTFGTLDNGWPVATFGSQTFHVDSAADEYGLQFSLPFNCKVDGAWFQMTVNSNADFNVLLTDSTGATLTGGSVAVDYNTVVAAAATRYLYVTFSQEVELTGNSTYQLSIQPTLTNSVITYYTSVNAAAHLQAMPGGTGFIEVSRAGGSGVFAATGSSTRRAIGGLRISAFDINSSTLSLFGGN
jgi:hypothetical protein